MIKISFLTLPLLTLLLGCDPNGSGRIAEAGRIQLIERPSADEAAIISRELDYQNDDRISYCEVLASDSSSYSGYRDLKLYPLASLSKVVTTAWVLKKLGPDFQFRSTWFIKPVPHKPGQFDAFLKTNYDPVFNLEKVLYSLSLLSAQGVQSIRNLVIDESTRVYLSALSQPHIELENVPINSSETLQNLKLILNSSNWSTQTRAAKQRLQAWAVSNKKKLNVPTVFSVDKVEIRSASTLNQNEYTQQIHIESSTVLKYLKNLNVFSNNYISDALFAYLGGTSEFRKFQNSELGLSEKDLILHTGSGLADNSSGVRKDNVGTCAAMLKVLNYIDQKAARTGLNLGHVLYNPAQDREGTFESSLDFTNQVVIKTGRLFEKPTLNLAGITATTKGSLYFVFLGHNFTANEAAEIELARDKMLTSGLEYYPTKDTFLTMSEFQIFLK